METYRVEWEIEIDAESPEEAAAEALRIQRDVNSMATCFKVWDELGNLTELDQEHLPTLEGVIDYLERQNDLAFLAYRRLSGGSEPGMHASVRARLAGEAYSIWTGVGEALYKAKEAAKNPGPGVTYIDTIQGMLDRHFGASKVK